MKIIVTGGLGHIGSQLIRRIPKFAPKCAMVIVDNLMTQRFCSLFNLPRKKKIKFIHADLNKLNVSRMLQKNDIVIHLAAITDAASSFGRESEINKNNFMATKKIARAIAKAKSNLIFISSTSVYGPQTKKVNEKLCYKKINPQSPYARIKLKEEQIIQKQKNLQYVILRFGTIVGVSPGMRFHTAINKFCFDLLKGQKIDVWKKSYKEVRPYLSLEDAINSIRFIIQKKLINKNIYNIVSENKSVANILNYIRKYTKKVKIRFSKSPYLNQQSYKVCNKKIKEEGFKFQKNSVENAIKKTLVTFNLCEKTR